MIDLHAHVLPALDDGPESREEAIELLEAASASGVRVVAATPHVSRRYPNTAPAVVAAVRSLAGDLAARGVPVDLVTGGEIEAEAVHGLPPEELRPLTLGGTGRYLLVELPFEGASTASSDVLRDLLAAGIRPLIAHPERQADIQAQPARAASLVERGCLLQLTASSLLGGHGDAARATARRLLEGGLAHVLSSDAHGRGIRRASLADGLAALRDDRLGRWLTEDVPAAILAGEDPPASPPRGRRRRLPWRA